MKKISIKISPAFFITAAIIGYINTASFLGVLIWVGIIFVSVLVHELGHALTAVLFGQRCQVELIAFGGLTIPSGPKLKAWKEFLVVFMGPLFGFLLFVLASIVLQFPFTNFFVRSSIQVFRGVNLFWTVVNLLPILPLDGGQLLRIVLEKIGGPKAWKLAIWISILLSSVASIFFFIMGQLIIGGLFFLFILQNLELLKRYNNYSDADRDEENQKHLKEAEVLFKMGQTESAAQKFEIIIEKTGKGLIHTIASESLAKILFDEGKYREAYKILSPIESLISREAKCILYLAAYEIGDYKRVIALSGVCFQEKQTAEVALRAAFSHAMVRDAHHAISWLKAASGFGGLDLKEVVKDAAFDAIREDKTFKKFLEATKKASSV